MSDNKIERDKFEASIKQWWPYAWMPSLTRSDEEYEQEDVDHAWQGWRMCVAALASQPAVAADQRERLDPAGMIAAAKQVVEAWRTTGQIRYTVGQLAAEVAFAECFDDTQQPAATNDLVKRLRDYASCDLTVSVGEHAEMLSAAADAIERLTIERDAAWEAGATWMRERSVEAMEDVENHPQCIAWNVTVHQAIKAAIRALATSKPE